ncbi:hypothetical protein JFY74_12950 [Pectobacterium carotovorum]|nr:hypothetical protein JFY74_12950 [Pectobacterium carotovorum]
MKTYQGFESLPHRHILSKINKLRIAFGFVLHKVRHKKFASADFFVCETSPLIKFVFSYTHFPTGRKKIREGYVWLTLRHFNSSRQQFRLCCDNAVHEAFLKAKQYYGALRLVDEPSMYNIKTIAANLRRQRLQAKASRKYRPTATVSIAFFNVIS